MLQEMIDPQEAERLGRSGWVGLDMFCEYSDLMSARNTRIYSGLSLRTDTTTQFKGPREAI